MYFESMLTLEPHVSASCMLWHDRKKGKRWEVSFELLLVGFLSGKDGHQDD
jgi:hypothetical protein